MKTIKVDRAIAQLLVVCRDQGWTVEPPTTSGSRFKLLSPDKSQPPVFIQCTTRGGRDLLNVTKRLERAGVQMPDHDKLPKLADGDGSVALPYEGDNDVRGWKDAAVAASLGTLVDTGLDYLKEYQNSMQLFTALQGVLLPALGEDAEPFERYDQTLMRTMAIIVAALGSYTSEIYADMAGSATDIIALESKIKVEVDEALKMAEVAERRAVKAEAAQKAIQDRYDTLVADHRVAKARLAEIEPVLASMQKLFGGNA